MHATPLAAALSLCILAASSAQVRPPRPVVRPATPFRLDPRTQRDDLLVVKFVEGARVRLLPSGKLQDLDGRDLTAVTRHLPGRKVVRLFTRSVADLDAERARLLPRVPLHEPLLADLNNYYLVGTAGRADCEALVDRLLEEPLIETCYPEFSRQGIVPLGDIPPTTPLFEAGQDTGFFGPATIGGHEYLSCRSIVGARGHRPGGVLTVAQLEGSWVFGHEDCGQLIPANVVGAQPNAYNLPVWWEHGTACVGILCAERNGYGVRGFANAAQLKLASLDSGSANMVSLTMAVAQPGDVFTSSFAFAVGGTTHAPRDWPQADFDAVRAATAAGIVYTFGAGNSATDLADPIYGGRYTAPTQSGGLIIGASDCGNLGIAGFSNRGARIDCHSWGGCGTTLGYGDLFQAGSDNRQNYTAGFSGTSQAGPLVAGCAAVLSGIIQEQLGRVPTVAELRTLLSTHGALVPGIGVRPDLRRMLRALGLPDGLLVTQEGSLGGSVTLETTAAPGRVYALLMSSRRGHMPSPFNRPLLLGTGVLVLAQSGVMPASGVQLLQFTVPNDPALADVNIYAQGLDFSGAMDGHLTNSVEIWIP